MFTGHVRGVWIDCTHPSSARRGNPSHRVWAACLLLAFGFAAFNTSAVRAAASDDAITDPVALLQLEQHAMSAEPREQCFLFTELLHSLTEEAGRELAAGEEEKAQATLKHADAIMSRMHAAVQGDAKRLKNAEMLMQHASRRLADMLHVAGDGSRGAVQSTLQKLNTLHSELLAQVFAK